MRNLNSYLAGVLIAFFGVFPPLYLAVQAPSHYWPWFVTCAAFAGFYTLFLRADMIVRLIGVGGFIHCFFSANPYESFTQYISIVACCYFYLICRSIKDYSIVFKFLKCLLVIHIFMFGMQFFAADRLLNFSSQVCFGVVGQRMQSASFSIILSAVLMSQTPLVLGFPMFTAIFCNSVGTFLGIISGLVPMIFTAGNKKFAMKFLAFLVMVFFIWAWLSGKFTENLSFQSGRIGAWKAAIILWFKRPWLGWGFGTFKGLFPALGGMNSIPWKTLHNCWGQILFEGGLFWFTISAGYYIYLVKNMIDLMRRRILRDKAKMCLAGLLMIGADMMLHFPTRMIQTVLILVFFMAYCQEVISNGARQSKSC